MELTPEDMKSLEGVVRYAARQAGGSMLEFEDASQIAWLAILDALDNYDPSKASLKTYAQRVAVGAVRDAANGFSSSMSVPDRTVKRYRLAVRTYGSPDAAYEHCGEFDMSPETFYDAHVALTGSRSFDAPTVSANDYTGHEEESPSLEGLLPFEWDNSPDVSVWEAIDTLSDKQQEAVRMYAQGMSTVDIGKRLGISQQAASLRVESAVDNLRNFYS
jgi:RNA polymerase sigma factor (sigma-70 family)